MSDHQLNVLAADMAGYIRLPMDQVMPAPGGTAGRWAAYVALTALRRYAQLLSRHGAAADAPADMVRQGFPGPPIFEDIEREHHD